MSDQTNAKDPRTIWRDQPDEIGAALLFVGVMAWRFAPTHNRLQELGFAAVIAWVVISFYRFRHRIWRRDPSRLDAVVATGLEYYRRELERRRDHLRNAWLWHGPLFLACVILIAILIERAFPGSERLRNVLPLVVLLAVWTGFGFRRRRRQAKELQREIDEIESLGTRERFERR
jgi:hypothetical protein